MKRWLLLLGLLAISTVVWASSSAGTNGLHLPDLFKIPPEDLSVWYLGNIFGSDLLGSLTSNTNISGIRLLSVVFGIFNQVALSVAIVIIVYTSISGVLSTAHEGKPLGEKVHSMWMPIRVSAGIALLVPSGGTGYCLAQSLVMWLTLQGIGAGDTVWNAMLDYFSKGGAIYSGESAKNTQYITEGNVGYTLALQGCPNNCGVTTSNPPVPKGANIDLLQAVTCVELFNNTPANIANNGGNRYEVFTLAAQPAVLFFGDRKSATADQPNAPAELVPNGTECGAVKVTVPACPAAQAGQPANQCADETSRQQIYTLANWNMAQSLQGLAKQLVQAPTDNKTWVSYYSSIFHADELYINYLVGYEDLLSAATYSNVSGGYLGNGFQTLSQYGWILAGNYYTILSAFQENGTLTQRNMIPPTTVTWASVGGKPAKPPAPTPQSPGDIVETARTNFWNDFYTGTIGASKPANGGFWSNTNKVDGLSQYIPSYAATQGIASPGEHYIGLVNMDKILSAVSGSGAGGHNTGNTHAQGGRAGVVTQQQVANYIRYLTGSGGG